MKMRKFLILLTLAVNLASLPTRAHPQELNLATSTQEDFEAITKYFARSVSEVISPFDMYHWRRDPSLVQSEDAQTHPAKYGRQIVQREGAGFVSGLYMKHRTLHNSYGGGLYLAFDAVVTESFGGLDPNQ